MKAEEVYQALAAHHAPPEWAIFPEVANATGGRATNRADAVALNLWPSRGLEVRGIEVKVSKSDIRRELVDPAKAEAVGKYCHTWYLAVPKGLQLSALMPMAWGIMEVEGGKVRVVKAAVPRPDGEVVQPSRAFIASLARAAHADLARIRKEWVPRESIAAEVEEAYRRGVESAPVFRDREKDAMKGKLDGARKVLGAIGIDVDEEGLGERMDGFVGERYAKALKLGIALMGRYGEAPAEVLRSIVRAQEKLAEVRAGVESLSKVEP